MNYRSLYVGIDQIISLENGQSVVPINFDNGATTPPMKCAVDELYKDLKWYGAIGRSKGQKNSYCTEKFNAARNEILKFFQLPVDGEHTVVYVKSATEGLNLLANILLKDKRGIVLTTRMEHHANLIPWRENAARVDYIDIDRMGRIHLQDIEMKLRRYRGRVRLVAITAASNVTGYVNDINKIARLCHRYGAMVVVDGAQIVAHRLVNLQGSCKEETIDFFAFSAHKAYAPFGGGAVVGLKQYLCEMDPFLKGGGAVDQVFDFTQTWLESPERMEAGTQNYYGVITMGSALNQLKEIGFDKIEQHENELKEYLLSRMMRMPELIIYGDVYNTADRLGIIVFNVKGKTHQQVADSLAKDYGIATRNGKFCAHPYVTRFLEIRNLPDNEDEQDVCGMVRLSLGLYNTRQEVDQFIQALYQISHS